MRKGFTLVEMLIVVVVLVTLMTITFRLGAINTASTERNTTVTRLQRLENCLSGYYAAFGSYPPVAMLNSRNPFLAVDDHGMQDDNEQNEKADIFDWDPDTFRRGSHQEKEVEAWEQVQAACKAQPVGCSFPFPEGYDDFVKGWSDQLRDEANDPKNNVSESKKKVFSAGFDDGVSSGIGRFAGYRNKSSWRDIQLFKFGLMSYLLPRFLVMMNAHESLYEEYAQWKGNNEMPSDPLTGDKFPSWYDVKEKATDLEKKVDYARVANIPSQAVCARWLPNLAGMVYTSHASFKVFGVDIADSESDDGFSLSTEIFSPGGYKNSSTANQYVLDYCTVRDGWWEPFYYYSPPPHQTYVLWSSGPNRRTFPPWISRDKLEAKANRCIGAWVEDDIVNMSH